MELENLITLVGKAYTAFDENQNYIGCLEPVYLLHNELPRFKLPQEPEKCLDFAIHELRKYSTPIERNQILAGDIITFKYPNELFHLGVYLGNNTFIHTFKDSALTINKIDLESKRVIGIYRITKLNKGELTWA